MKLAIISPFPPYRGGISKETEVLYNSLKKKHSVTIYNFKRLYPQIIFPGKSQFLNNYKSPNSIRSIDSLNLLSWHRTAEIINKEKYDKIIFRFWHPFLSPIYSYIISRLKKKDSKIKIFCICDNIYPHEKTIFDKFLLKIFLKRVDRFLTMSSITSNQINKIYPGSNISEIFLPIKDIYGSKISKKIACQKLNIKYKFNILFFGLVRSYKGLDIALKAMKGLIDKNKKFHFIIAGESYENEDKYLSIIKKNSLENFVTWHNSYIDDDKIHLYFSASDLVLLPYKHATQSGVIPIAYNFNKPVVTSNLRGLKEYVDPTMNYLFDVGSHDDLVSLLINIINTYDYKIIEKNIKNFKKKFSVKELNKKIENLISE